MGLFDPPAVGIRKRIPQSHHADYDALNHAITQVMPDHLNRTQQGLVAGYVSAAWVLHENRNKRLPLEEKLGRYISNMGMNCVRMLKDLQPMALYMASELIPDLADDETGT